MRLHGQLAVPSLKHISSLICEWWNACLHGQLAVPSLKHEPVSESSGHAEMFARPIGRALIEARNP